MKHLKLLCFILSLLLFLAACDKAEDRFPEAVKITLSDDLMQVDGRPISTDAAAAVYAANDIVYYASGKDFTYGEGETEDAHTPEEAAEHTVVHISKPGVYRISGKLSQGQIAVDLGENAKKDPEAVVTLILDGADITCTVAPAVIFYNVYECGDTENPTKDVDTSAAGANVIIADDSENTVNGSYVARIYKPDSVVLNQQGTEVEEAEKLHKYDGAFYSKMSMNIAGEKENTGILNIHAKNEGLDSELHLTINGGNISILSGNDGINTNEDGVSVTTVNGGALKIQVTGETGEGDGIDSNGWLVINGGSVIAAACATSADAGIDSDMGIHINGGTVIATGGMLDHIQDGGQTYAVFNFAQKQNGNDTITLKDAASKIVLQHIPQNAYSVFVYSSPGLMEGVYTLWNNDQQLTGQAGGRSGGPGMGHPEGMMPQGGFDNNKQPPEGFTPPAEGMQLPQNFAPPQGAEQPNGGEQPPERPKGDDWQPNEDVLQERSPDFSITAGANMFTVAQEKGLTKIGQAFFRSLSKLCIQSAFKK